MHEDDIRDRLAERLDLLRPGLVLIQTNYYLRNPEGSRGYIDILAKDDSGCLVVIELKRADDSAREAVQEVCKYVELLNRQEGIPFPGLRAVIVSTTWHELRVPYSHFKRSWPHHLEGFHLTLDSDGLTPVSVEPVEPLPEVMERGLTPVHAWLTGLSEQALAGAWQDVVSAAAEVGADDLLGVHLEHDRVGDALYVALGAVDALDPRTALQRQQLADESADDFSADSGELAFDYLLEEAVLGHVMGSVTGAWLPAYPEKFATLTEQHHWQIKATYRAGVFGLQNKLVTDPELMQMLAGDLGLGRVRYLGKSRPNNRLHWGRFRALVARCLGSNAAWQEPLSLRLDEVERETPNRDVVVKLYNPEDLIAHLVWSASQDAAPIGRLMPSVEGAIDAPGQEGRMFAGTLTWDGTPVEIEEGFARVYGDDAGWGLARHGNPEHDARLLHEWHLAYSMCEFQPGDGGGSTLIAKDGHLLRTSFTDIGEGFGPDGQRPVWDFFEAHEGALRALVERLSTKIIVLGDLGTQAFVDDGASDGRPTQN
jgi:hypothetical protein